MDYKPGDIAIIDQFIDRTTKRCSTFYDGSTDICKGVSHIPMANPFCEPTRKLLIEACRKFNITCHETGTLVVIEGPRFSTKAESELYRSWNCDLIGMTAVPEVALAREAGLSFAIIANITDYDSWKDDDNVNVATVMQTLKENASKSRKVMMEVIARIAAADWTDVVSENELVAMSSVV